MGFGAKVWAVFKTGMCLILLGSLAACQGGMGSYAGKTVDAKDRIELLEGGPHPVSWETRDLLVEFQYTRKRQDLQISGLIKPQQYLSHFNSIKHLYLRLHFVDAGGKVLADQALLKSTGYRVQMPEKIPFKAELQIPPAGAAVAFSYRGRAQGGGERAEDWEFWKMP
jgi:hypothetical protein